MNSFNHYAYGSVCEAIYSRIAGLRNLAPGWKKVMIKPQLNYRMKKIEFSYNSISGKYEISWEWINKKFSMNVSIPYGSEAEIILPDGISHHINEGKYYFECELSKKIYSPFSIDIPIIDLIKNNETSKIIQKLLPDIYQKSIEKNSDIIKYSIRTANELLNFNYPIDIIIKCNEDLSKINP